MREWHMRQRLAPMRYGDTDTDAAKANPNLNSCMFLDRPGTELSPGRPSGEIRGIPKDRRDICRNFCGRSDRQT
jgi:hypothetical protein